MITAGVGLFILFILIVSGCGPSKKEIMAKSHLANAKEAYAYAEANPDVKMNAQLPLMEARVAVEAASKAKEFDEMDHLAYQAEKKTQIAVATAEERMSENAKRSIGMETARLMAQGQEREQTARKEAMDSDTSARESSAEALSQKQEAEETRAENDRLQQEIIDMKGKISERGIVLTMGDVLFAPGSAGLSSKAGNEISKLAVFLKKYPNRNVLIEGYTDNTGTDEMKRDLSLKRADAVSNQLVAQKISRDRITIRGLGEESPVADNDTEMGRMQNRRVNIVILNEGDMASR
jgi:outer membrane protein OmpA-like peptidoglycan-associated protein